MDFPKEISINGKPYALVDIQRSGSGIYRDDATYLRIGAPDKISADLALHKQMEGLGFPVAKLLSEGRHEGLAYFIEESLGDECFGTIFKKETEAHGQVSDETFAKFLDIVSKFATAQLKTIRAKKDWENFQQGIHLDLMVQELPEINKEILGLYQSAQEELADFPFGILHGDFTPFNIYPKGVIDLEDSFLGPVSYDVGALPIIQNWFPATAADEFYRNYKLSPQQNARYLKTLDDIYATAALPKISDYLAAFNITKGIWFTVRMHNLPKLQQFRYELLKTMIN